jgi:hypothetical protein
LKSGKQGGNQIEIPFTPEKFGMIEHIDPHSENQLAPPLPKKALARTS